MKAKEELAEKVELRQNKSTSISKSLRLSIYQAIDQTRMGSFNT